MLLVSAVACSSDDSSTVAWADQVLDRQGVDRLHTTHPVLSQVWRDPARQANLARVIRQFEVHPLDESMSVGQRICCGVRGP